MDIMVDYHDSTSLAQELKLIQILFLGNRARIMVIMLDIHIEYHYWITHGFWETRLIALDKNRLDISGIRYDMMT